MQKEQIIQAQAGPAEKKQLIDSLPRLKGKKVLIVGDVGLDEYVLGHVRRISPEAPVPVLEVESEDKRLGLAANISQNIVSLGGQALTVGVVGVDTGADLLKDLCRKTGVSWDGMIVDGQRPTTRKTRVMAQHHHLVRVDYELTKYLSPETEARVLQKTKELLPSADIVILQDYAKGVVSESLTKAMVEICRDAGKRLLVDPHRSKGAEFYHGVDLIKPNYDESVALSGLRFDDLKDNPDKVYDVGRALQKKTGAHEVVLTRGKEGMTIFAGDAVTEVPTYARKVFDVTGAGDTVIAALSLGLASGLNLVQSCMLANFAAGVVVGKIGCVPCEVGELVQYIQEPH
ncbi:MAG: D-glycero-beta-D-manno-heptose-7-phosphate kinase [Bdellovibrionaceae bacterium]|nr:D-glycero-beta-D-manno-heptose-7-phosphate kinase [Pseudobdellovibrionaceae bacterium]